MVLLMGIIVVISPIPILEGFKNVQGPQKWTYVLRLLGIPLFVPFFLRKCHWSGPNCYHGEHHRIDTFFSLLIDISLFRMILDMKTGNWKIIFKGKVMKGGKLELVYHMWTVLRTVGKISENWKTPRKPVNPERMFTLKRKVSANVPPNRLFLFLMIFDYCGIFTL